MAFENNVSTALYADVLAGATTILVDKATAPARDVPASGKLTLKSADKFEIISYQARVDQTLFWELTGVVKNAESNFGDQAWTAGDEVFQAITAGDLQAMADGISSTVFANEFPADSSPGTSLFKDGTLYQLMTDGTNQAWVDIGTGGGVPAPTDDSSPTSSGSATSIAQQLIYS